VLDQHGELHLQVAILQQDHLVEINGLFQIKLQLLEQINQLQ
jgi:hypothetical protein